MVSQNLYKEKGMVDQVIANVRRVTYKNFNEVERIKEDNRILQAKIRHVKELIDLRNPANAKNDDVSKNFDNSSMKSGGGLSISGSVINEVQKSVNIFGALSTLSH
jgi:hypothetical protein